MSGSDVAAGAGSFATDGRATLAQIPAGYYEFWPYANDQEAELLIDSAMAAPIALHVTPGENDVKVRFEARR